MDDALRRTVPVKLDVPEERRGDLHQTKAQFLHCANRTSEWAWRYDDYCVTNKSKAENALYDELREETDLTANLVQKGIRRAIEAVQSGVEKLKQGEQTSQPEFDSWSVVYDKRSASFNDDYATLSTPDGRVTAEYVLPPEDEREDTPFGRYYESEAWDASIATLQYDEQEDAFYLHVTLKNPNYEGDGTERQESESRSEGAENGVVLGVDLNVTGAFAVTSTGEFIGSADSLTHKRNQYEQRRAKLQQTGTRSAHLTMQSIGSRLSDWSLDWLHNRANDLITEAQDADVDGIIFETLDHIRENIANGSKFQQWAYAKFVELVEYKVESTELFVDTVNPAYTSQRCSHCGFTHEDNRDDKAFECQSCGYEVNADYNAAKNIANRYCGYIHRGQKSRGGWATSQLALKSGTLSVNGDYTPTELLG
ncbi:MULTISPECIES: RNA-guided endonuclease InsQ/TnpB family protein [Halobacteriales]|uniref:Transposase, IS605 OrfB family, central region n=3 Tax=Halobacteriales TaxID=2235 RepID=A0A1H3JZT0_9EURY|nr:MULTISPECIES: RNA-guided endonuclease TnpB family protein [Halobacteria]AGB33712.1 transposase, IS605 OrfB family, central region [Natrinema pellirubrum DSM 15624]ELY76534.1 IS1341-type transposase [Natrinema pellirubrum DSM 15624]SDY45035.1 transposase, IS605 OrfB family, central region [Halobellus clavatus]